MNLLLEGPDLSELLLRAARTGGAQTRIVRAEKVRRGGVLGFFAHEGFEVDIEIPAESDDSPDAAPVAHAQDEPPPPIAEPGPSAAGSQVRLWTPPELHPDRATVHDHDPQFLRDHARLHGLRAAEHNDVLFVPSQLVPTSLLELAERVSATEQAGARSMSLHARYAGAQPQPWDVPVQPSWPVLSNLSPAPTVNRLNESGSSADLAGVSEPFEQSLPVNLDGFDGLDDAADELDDDSDLGDDLGAVFQLDSHEPLGTRGTSATSSAVNESSSADASGYDASLGYGTDGEFAIETEFTGGDFDAIDEFGPTSVFGAVDDAPDYGADFGKISFEVDPAYADEPLHDVPTPGLLEPISHDLPTPGLVPAFEEPAAHDAVPGLVPPLEQPIDHLVSTPGLMPSPEEPAAQVVPHVVPGLEPPLTQYVDETHAAHAAHAAHVEHTEPAPALEVPEPRRLSTYEEIDALASSQAAEPDAVAEEYLDEYADADEDPDETFEAEVSDPANSSAAMPLAAAGQQIAPSASRPQFTAMIDHLRDGFRLGKHRLDGPRHTPDHPVVAETAGLPGNSAIFVSPGEGGAASGEGAAWSSVVDPDGHSATAPLEAERTMTTLTEPSTDTYDEQAGLAGPAAEGPDNVDSDGISLDGADDANESGSDGISTLTLANARATTIVPSGKSRSRRRAKNVPVPRPAVDDEPVLISEPEPAAATVVATIEPSGPADLADLAGSPLHDAPFGDDSYAGPEGYADADDELLGQPDLGHPDAAKPARSGSAAWRMLRSLRPRRRRDRDDDEDLWVPETVIDADADQDVADAEHWTHSDEYSAEYPSERSNFGSAEAGASPYRLDPPSFGEPGIFGQAGVQSQSRQPVDSGFAAAAGPRASAAGLPEGSQDQLALDREALRALGVPAAWTRHLQPGDRFASIVMMLERLPQLEIPEDVSVIAVVGPADVVELEAHRTALDLPADGRPRAVAPVPGQAGADRRSAVAQSKRTRPVVVAIAVEGYDDPAETRKVIASVKAESVIAIVDAARPLDETARWIEALEHVDAIALDGALDGDRPAEVLGLEVPVIRVDGIAVDRIGWAALLCAQLTVLDMQRTSVYQ